MFQWKNVTNILDVLKYVDNYYPHKFTIPFSKLINYFGSRVKWVLEEKDQIKNSVTCLRDSEAQFNEVRLFYEFYNVSQTYAHL